jgi:hypothetical protein
VGAVTAITNALPAGTNVIGHVITDLGSVAAITGAKGNNTAIPSTTNLGTLPCVATTAAPTYTNTYQVACSTDLAGAMRVSVVSGSAGNGAASPTASAVPSDADYQGINVGGTLRGQTGTNTSGSIYAADVNIAAAPAMVYNATQPTKTDGQTFPDFQLTNRGELKVAPGVSGFAVTSTSSITDCATETTVCSAPVPIGAVYYSSPTALTNGQVAYPLLDTDHRLTTNIGKINGVTPLMGAGNTGTGSLRVTVASDQVTIPVTILPAATSGWSSINATAADSGVPCTSTPEPIKASQGVFGGYFITNPNTADMWVHIYNVAYGSVTVGTTVPQLSFRIPGNSTESRAANLEISQGIQFSAAMSYACTTSAAANGNPSTALEADFFYR